MIHFEAVKWRSVGAQQAKRAFHAFDFAFFLLRLLKFFFFAFFEEIEISESVERREVFLRFIHHRSVHLLTCLTTLSIFLAFFVAELSCFVACQPFFCCSGFSFSQTLSRVFRGRISAFFNVCLNSPRRLQYVRERAHFSSFSSSFAEANTENFFPSILSALSIGKTQTI